MAAAEGEQAGVSEFKTICAWCDRILGGNLEAAIISHGICQSCMSSLLDDHFGEESLDELWLDYGGEA